MADYKKGDTASWDTEQVRRSTQSGGQRKRPRKKKRKTPWILKFIGWLLFVAISSCILAGVGWMLMNDLHRNSDLKDLIFQMSVFNCFVNVRFYLILIS